MKLTRTERWVLVNQFKILEKVDPELADAYRDAQDVLGSGYELGYRRLVEGIFDDQDCLSEEECVEVLDALRMYEDIQRSYAAVEDKSDIDQYLISFPGFDGNSEVTRLGYCRHFCEGRTPRYENLQRPKDWNSHMPMLDVYRRMMPTWRDIREKLGHSRRDLTKREILEILVEWPHPESELGRLRDVKPLGHA